MHAVYLAGPLGFSEPGRHFHTNFLIPLLEEHGFEVLDPWSLVDTIQIEEVSAMNPGEEKLNALKRLDQTIAEKNLEALNRADILLAVLDGPDVDSGTAGEIGYAFGRRIPIVGYRSDIRQSGENDGCTVNLQIEYFIRSSGGTIVTLFDDIVGALQQTAKSC